MSVATMASPRLATACDVYEHRRDEVLRAAEGMLARADAKPNQPVWQEELEELREAVKAMHKAHHELGKALTGL